MATRHGLVKKASDVAEAARVAIRSARHQGQKAIKTDEQNSVVGTSDAKKDDKKVSFCEFDWSRGFLAFRTDMPSLSLNSYWKRQRRRQTRLTKS
jgi:type II secretory pathway pseudopilin PulG